MTMLALGTGLLAAVAGNKSEAVAEMPLTQSVRIAVISDDQGAGQGAGFGKLYLTGARKQSWPYKLMLGLRAAGVAAYDNSFFAAAVPDNNWWDYDSRVYNAEWGFGNSTLGGRLFYADTAGKGTPSFSPEDDVDTFEFINLQYHDGAIIDWAVVPYGSTEVLESGTVDQDNGGGMTGTIVHTMITSTAGKRTLTLTRDDENSYNNTAYAIGVLAFDSSINAAQIINLSAIGWSTEDWVAQNGWLRAYDVLPSIQADVAIISLGSYDRVVNGVELTPSAFKANMQNLMDRTTDTVSHIVLVLPMPISQVLVGSITDAELLQVYQELATENSCPLIRTDLLLGSWETGDANGEVSDQMHWKSSAHQTVATALVPTIMGILSDWAA